MRIMAFIVAVLVSAGSAQAAETCKGNADDKKLSGAARTSFMTKCEKGGWGVHNLSSLSGGLAEPRRAKYRITHATKLLLRLVNLSRMSALSLRLQSSLGAVSCVSWSSLQLLVFLRFPPRRVLWRISTTSPSE